MQIYVYQILLSAVRTQTNVFGNKWIERENLWIKPHVGLIKIISHFNGAHFDDKFITFRVASCIMVPDPIFSQGFVLQKFLAEITLAIIRRC